MERECSVAHNISSSRRGFLAAVGGASTLALSGCLVHGEDSGLDGEILVDGSDTLLPHGAALAEEFQWRNNRVRIPIRGSGTGAGFERFCAGETHLQNASRQILDDEIEEAEANGIDYLELEVAVDGIAVWVNPRNDWCDCLTVDELEAIWGSGTDVETWSDVREEWPDEEIDLYGRDAASGTFDYFTEALTGEIGNIRSDYSASADTNVIVRGVRGNQYAIGFGGAGYYYENEDDLKLLGVDDGDGCVQPARESIESAEYTPLSRSMYVYLRTDQLSREEYREYARFFFEPIDDQVEAEVDGEPAWTQWAARRVGYYAIDDSVVENDREKLEEAISTHG
ncbi:PstS family phosphate ABC transporter substrate-binding protein [Haloferacaceae archaeon DSL9]